VAADRRSSRGTDSPVRRQGSGLTEDVTIPLGGWLLQFSPAYAQRSPMHRYPTGQRRAGRRDRLRGRAGPGPGRAGFAPAIPALAGEPILEQCLAGLTAC